MPTTGSHGLRAYWRCFGDWTGVSGSILTMQWSGSPNINACQIFSSLKHFGAIIDPFRRTHFQEYGPNIRSTQFESVSNIHVPLFIPPLGALHPLFQNPLKPSAKVSSALSITPRPLHCCSMANEHITHNSDGNGFSGVGESRFIFDSGDS